jgi:hypothetical protein
MKTTLLLAFSVFPLMLSAQPVISDGSNIPQPGVTFPVSFATTTAPGLPGANQTWDFSALSFVSVGNVEVIAPSSSPIGSSFPNATFALSLVGQNSYSFFQVSATKKEVLAWTISTPGTGNDYSPNPKTTLPFPFNFQDAVTDTWQKVGGSLENVTVSYDGYGTLITPTQTYSNVVRVKEDYGGTDIDYAWYLTNPLMTVAIYNHNNNALYHFGLSQITGVNDNNQLANNLEVYPNPAENEINVINCHPGSTVSIIDLAGRIVFTEIVVKDRTILNTSQLSNGVYFVQVSDMTTIQRSRFLVNH